MSSVGLLSSLLNTQGSDPAGSSMRVEMLPIDSIIPNPDNKIYQIGDVAQLAEDIRKNGVRQPLEVVRQGDVYKLIGGERRLTACRQLLGEQDTRFETLPCIIRESQGELDDRIALITANATARELTDGERLSQYEALKNALTEKKKAGQLEGKVRDALCKILGEGSGTLARLNVISSCENGVIKERLRAGEIGLMEAYRDAQDYMRFTRKIEDNPEPVKAKKETAPEASPKNPNHAEQNPLFKAIALAEESQQKDASATPSDSKPAAENKRGFNVLLQLAEKELARTALWEFDHNLWQFQLDFYKHPLPGGATLWKLCDLQRDAHGYAPEEHERYAIILCDGNFKSIGWESYNDALVSLANYLDIT